MSSIWKLNTTFVNRDNRALTIRYRRTSDTGEAEDDHYFCALTISFLGISGLLMYEAGCRTFHLIHQDSSNVGPSYLWGGGGAWSKLMATMAVV